MKHLRNVIATLVLALALAINAYGGDQHTPGFCEGPNCPPPPCTSECEATTDPDAEEIVGLPADESDYLFDTLMALLSVY